MTIKQLFTATAAALAASIVLFLCSCSRKISGVVKEVKGDTVTISKEYRYRFKVTTPAALGDTVTFTPTKNKKRVNGKRLHTKYL